jgi:putative ABC transport system ATP-binding protein
MIRMNNASKVFPAKNGRRVAALRQITLEIQRGEFVMVVGPSGSGKSTLLFTVGGMQHPTEGSVCFEDTNLYDLSPSRRAALRRTRIGFVFQSFHLLPRLSVLENVLLPQRYASTRDEHACARAHELLERIGLGPRVHHLPGELLGGQLQRAAIARALLNQPALLLADEPTGNLDSAQGDEMMRILRELNAEGTTLVMVTHSLTHAAEASRTLRLLDGHILNDALAA